MNFLIFFSLKEVNIFIIPNVTAIELQYVYLKSAVGVTGKYPKIYKRPEVNKHLIIILL